MKSDTLAVLCFAAAAFASVPALAAPGACVPNNRIQSTRVMNNTTIVVTDMSDKTYTVHMHGACVGLDQSAINLSFRTKTQLGCLSPGDTISYSLPGDRQPVQVRPNLQTPCVIDTVTEGLPAAH
jgi:hypothetical protein